MRRMVLGRREKWTNFEVPTAMLSWLPLLSLPNRQPALRGFTSLLM